MSWFHSISLKKRKKDSLPAGWWRSTLLSPPLLLPRAPVEASLNVIDVTLFQTHSMVWKCTWAKVTRMLKSFEMVNMKCLLLSHFNCWMRQQWSLGTRNEGPKRWGGFFTYLCSEEYLQSLAWGWLVDCPTQLICTWIFICSMIKLKEHSREIC